MTICFVDFDSEVVVSEAKHDIVGSQGKKRMCTSVVKQVGSEGKHDTVRSEAKHDIVGSEGKHDTSTDCIPEHVRSEGRRKRNLANAKGKGIRKRDRDQESAHEEK